MWQAGLLAHPVKSNLLVFFLIYGKYVSWKICKLSVYEEKIMGNFIFQNEILSDFFISPPLGN